MDPQQGPVIESPIPVPVPVTVAAPIAVFAPPYQPAVEDNPGRMLGIVGMVLSIVGLGLVGLILGIISLVKSNAAHKSNGFAVAAIVLGILNIICVITVISVVIVTANTPGQY